MRDAERWTQKRGATNTRFGTAVGGSPPLRLRIYRRFADAFFSLFFFLLFFHNFRLSRSCPHHMSFTSNYRKLRVSPNARELKYAPPGFILSLSLSDPTGCRKRSRENRTATGKERGCWRGRGCLIRPNTIAASDPWRSQKSNPVFLLSRYCKVI